MTETSGRPGGTLSAAPSRRRPGSGRVHALEAAGLAVAALVAVAFLVWGAHMGRAGEPAGGTLWPAGHGSLVVWRSAGGTLTARTTDATGAVTVSSLGFGEDARLVSGGARPVLLVTSPDGGRRLVRYRPSNHLWSPIAVSLEPAGLACATTAGGLAYLPAGSGPHAAVLAVDGRGHTVARYPLPVLEPDPDVFLTPLGGDLGAAVASARAGRGHVADLLTAGGDVLAVSATRAAAALTDLQSGASVSLASYTDFLAAVVGGDGSVYILAGGSDPAFSVRFLRVTVHPLRVVSVWDTGVAPTGEAAWALPTRFGAIFYAPAQPGSPEAYSQTNIWLVDGSGAHQNSAVSSDVGERMGPGRRDSVLFYGRPGDGAVERLDTDDGALGPASAGLGAPPGATILLAAD